MTGALLGNEATRERATLRFGREAADLAPEMVRVRRDLHAHPELGFAEERTARLVATTLRDLGFTVRTGVGQTGVVGDLKGARAGPTVLLRFDMDALPIQEATGLPFASTRPGAMHGCGHDGHVAIGLAVARMLAARRNAMQGGLRFVFQPAEELISGAKAMVADGVLDPPRPDAALSLHLWNERPYGWAGATTGPGMAAADKFIIEIRGQGGHGATPHHTRDPVVAAAHIVTALQSVVARNVAPLESAVLSVTSIKAGEAFNVIPSTATILGTIRCFDPGVHATVRRRAREVVDGVARAMGCEATIAFTDAAKAVVNDAALSARARALAALLPGITHVSADERTMGSEDFPFLVDGYPSCYMFVGAGIEGKPESRGHHHPQFDWDERALPVAAALVAELAADLVL